jgi:hypothetical protein
MLPGQDTGCNREQMGKSRFGKADTLSQFTHGYVSFEGNIYRPINTLIALDTWLGSNGRQSELHAKKVYPFNIFVLCDLLPAKQPS